MTYQAAVVVEVAKADNVAGAVVEPRSRPNHEHAPVALSMIRGLARAGLRNKGWRKVKMWSV